MSVRTGDTAPGFELPAAPGELVDVGAAFGKGPVVLLFFPLAFSSTCTDEMCAVRDGWEDWSGQEAQVFGICPDSPFVTKRFREDLALPFPILADFNRDVSRTYGVLYEEFYGLRDVPKRSCFVVASSGQVVLDWVSDDSSKLPDFTAVRRAIG